MKTVSMTRMMVEMVAMDVGAGNYAFTIRPGGHVISTQRPIPWFHGRSQPRRM